MLTQSFRGWKAPEGLVRKWEGAAADVSSWSAVGFAICAKFLMLTLKGGTGARGHSRPSKTLTTFKNLNDLQKPSSAAKTFKELQGLQTAAKRCKTLQNPARRGQAALSCQLALSCQPALREGRQQRQRPAPAALWQRRPQRRQTHSLRRAACHLCENCREETSSCCFCLSSLHHVTFVVSQIALPVVAHFVDSCATPGKISTLKVVQEIVIFPQSHGSTLSGEHS